MPDIRIQKYFFWLFSVFLITLVVVSCMRDQKFRHLTINTSNALRVTLDFETDREMEISIDYWETDKPVEVNSKNSHPSTNHHLVLYKLNPDTEYHFILRAGKSPVSDTLEFHTVEYPIREPFFQVTLDSGKVFNGYLLIRKVEYPAQQLILDNTGKIVWYQMLDSAVSRFFSWTDENTILSLNTEEHIQEFDLEGNILFDLRLGEKGFVKPLHHEIIKDEKGNILSLTRNMKLYDLTEFGGVERDTIFGDGILVLDSTGNKVWEWDIYKHEDPLHDPNIERMKKDWSHANALAIDRDGNYLVSFRNFHQIWKIDSSSGKILWKLGLHGDFNMNEEALFYSQHAVLINRFGELMLFDNGLPDTQSRALSFRIGPDGEAKVGRYDVALPRRLYSFKEGSAYLITEDKILFCSTRNNIIVVTDKQGNILWELYSPEPLYRAYYLTENIF